MNLRFIVKTVFTLASGVGAYKLSRDVIDANTDDPTSTTDKVVREAGAIAIGTAVSDVAASTAEKYVDDLFDSIDRLKTTLNKKA